MSDIKAKIQALSNSKSEDDRRACIGLLADYLSKNPQDVSAWYDKACCHDFIGEEKEAEPCYRKCYELGWQKLPESEHKGFFVGYGSTLRNNLKFIESITILKEGVTRFPDYAPLKIFLALSYYSDRQDRQAAEELFPACLEAANGGLDGFERAARYYVDHLRDHPEVRDGQYGAPAASSIQQPRLETARLILEPYKDSDIDDVFAYASNPEVAKYVMWEHHKTKEDSPLRKPEKKNEAFRSPAGCRKNSIAGVPDFAYLCRIINSMESGLLSPLKPVSV